MAFTADDQQAVHVRFSQKQKRHAKRVVAQPEGHSRIELEEQAAVDLTQVTYRNASKKGKISRQLTAAGAVHATVTCPKTKREKNKKNCAIDMNVSEKARNSQDHGSVRSETRRKEN